VQPVRSFVVGANARCGSTLLCRALADTGVAGRPEEYFITGPAEAFPPGWKFWEEGPLALEHGVSDRRAYLELVFRLGTTGNGVFGVKMMWNYVPWALEKLRELPEYRELSQAEAFAALLPGLRLVQLVRRDRIRQAVSWLRAAQEGVWVVSDTEPATPSGEPRYDFAVIAGMERLIIEGEEGWGRFAAELGLARHVVTYEDLVAPDRYPDVLSGVLEFLEVDGAGTAPPAPRTWRQADGLNEEWAERFERERAARIALGSKDPGEQCPPGARVRLGEDGLEVILHRVLGQEHQPRDVTGRRASDDMIKQLCLT
jgi:trehalose 2-sulfotransferase